MEKNIATTQGWYAQLINDIKIHTQIKIVEAKHYCGRRILQEKQKLESVYGKRFVERIAGDLDISKTEIYNCIQFAQQYPELSDGVGELSWRRIVHELLPEPEEKNKFEWFLYNVWNTSNGDGKDYFGHFPLIFMRNILHYHTKENDLIYDPFAGSGTTAEVCELLNRRYYCSDLFPQRDFIHQWDVGLGIPDDLLKPDLAFLDPPYWWNSKGKYSKKENDLGNMNLENYRQVFNDFLKELIRIKSQKIAIVIQPTHLWPNTEYNNTAEYQFKDLIFEFYEILRSDYKIDMRYSLPYSTQQLSAYYVNIAKKERFTLNIIRDLVIWSLINEEQVA